MTDNAIVSPTESGRPKAVVYPLYDTISHLCDSGQDNEENRFERPQGVPSCLSCHRLKDADAGDLQRRRANRQTLSYWRCDHGWEVQ